MEQATTPSPLKKTPLNARHRTSGARMVAFGGWDMPVEYSGIVAEHMAVRERAGLFDVSHMGEIEIAGRNALDAVQRISSNDASKLQVGQAHYSGLMSAAGTFVDDLLVYRLGKEHFLLVVNASHIAADYAHIAEHIKPAGDAVAVDASSRYALIAQLYAACWQVLSTAAFAYWPAFVKRRSAAEETIRMWWRLSAALGGAALIATVALVSLGPWAAGVLSGGRIDISPWLGLAFGLILIGQSIHLPTFVLLTRPDEARWQAMWTVAMAVVSIGLGYAVADRFGAVGVACAAALGIFAVQVIPDLLWVPKLVRRRPASEV